MSVCVSVSHPTASMTIATRNTCSYLYDTHTQILMEDLFGLPAEEREVGEAIARIPESKTPQSLASYEIAAQFLSPKLIPDLLAPVKQVHTATAVLSYVASLGALFCGD